MNKQEQVQQMTTYMANFVSHIAKVLPDDIIKKLDELGAQEDAPLSKVIYETMKRNQKLAKEQVKVEQQWTQLQADKERHDQEHAQNAQDRKSTRLNSSH